MSREKRGPLERRNYRPGMRMNDEIAEFMIKLVVAIVFTPCIKGGAWLLFAYDMAWWLAAAIALVVVFGGWLIIDDDGIC